MLKLLFIILSTAIISACASYPSNPAEQAAFHTKQAEELIEKGDSTNSANQINDALDKSNGGILIKELFQRRPVGQIHYKNSLERMIDAAEFLNQAESLDKYIRKSEQFQLFTEIQLRDLTVKLKSKFEYIYKQEAAQKNLVQLAEVERQKIADGKRKATENETARRMESRLRTQRALELAVDKARFTCKDRIECDKAFSLTQIFIVSNSDMKVQVANDTIIETYNSTEEMKISLKAIKMPRAGSTAEIILSLNCRDEGKESFKDLCYLKSMRIYSDFPQFVQKNLIR